MAGRKSTPRKQSIGSYTAPPATGSYELGSYGRGSYGRGAGSYGLPGSYRGSVGSFGALYEPTVAYAASSTQRVSVVVTARNYGRFLAECLHSVLAQSVRPAEIIYCDDGSDDGSLEIARRFENDGVRSIALARCGVVAARNHAVAASSGDLLLHVDADDLLAPDYIASQLRALNGAAVAYCSKQHFGTHDEFWQPPNWNREQLWLDNFIHTSAVVRREAFEAAGGWIETPAEALWDWNLWLRVTRGRDAVRSDAVLHYRRHADNWSHRRQNAPPDRAAGMKGEIRRSAVRLTVCLVYSGRLPALVPTWLDAVLAATSHLRRDQLELFVLDDSPRGFWSAAGPHVEQLNERFESLRIVRIHRGTSWCERRTDGGATAQFLARAYNRFLDESESDVLWFVEDDVVVPPDSGNRLLRLLLDGDCPKAAVTGLYKSRHDDRYVAARVLGQRVAHLQRPPVAAEPCDVAGTGCLMILRPMAKASFRPFWPVPGNGHAVPGHDWSFTWQLKELGRPVWINPQVRCRHYLNEEAWI
jgi:glycosyltransferase involved in cell wall biosynthesis